MIHRISWHYHPSESIIQRSLQLRHKLSRIRDRVSPSEKPSQSSRKPKTVLQQQHRCIDQIWVPLAALSGFSFIAYGIFGSESENLLLQCDHDVHEWIHSTIPMTIREGIFDRIISNIFIELDLILGVGLLLVRIRGHPRQGFVLLGLTCLFFTIGVGSHTYEPILVHVLKQTFHRQRPQPMLESYAFPSGHVTSAVSLTGAFLFVLLPAASETISDSRNEEMEDEEHSLRHLLQSLNEAKDLKMVIWLLSFLCTAIGRIGGDVHWVSDTLGACALGIALTSIFESIHSTIISKRSTSLL